MKGEDLGVPHFHVLKDIQFEYWLVEDSGREQFVVVIMVCSCGAFSVAAMEDWEYAIRGRVWYGVAETLLKQRDWEIISRSWDDD